MGIPISIQQETPDRGTHLIAHLIARYHQGNVIPVTAAHKLAHKYNICI